MTKRWIAPSIVVITCCIPVTASAASFYVAGANLYSPLRNPYTGGPLSNLSKSVVSATNFNDLMTAAGHTTVQSYNSSVVISDWNPDSLAEGTDLAYFTGHGAPTGWILPQDNGSGIAAQVKPGMFNFGTDGKLRWITLDACQVLMNASTWQSSFSGLHSITGATTLTNDSGARGTAYANNLRAGQTIKNAWFNALISTDSLAGPAIYGIRGQNIGGTSVDTINDYITSTQWVSELSWYSVTF